MSRLFINMTTKGNTKKTNNINGTSVSNQNLYPLPIKQLMMLGRADF